MAPRFLGSTVLTLLAGCAFQPGGPGAPEPEAEPAVDAAVVADAPAPTVACRVEEDLIGVVGLVVTSSQGTFVFESWRAVAPGLYDGFVLRGPLPVRYEVRFGRQKYEGEVLTFVRPEPATADASAITRVELCLGRGGDD